MSTDIDSSWENERLKEDLSRAKAELAALQIDRDSAWQNVHILEKARQEQDARIAQKDEIIAGLRVRNSEINGDSENKQKLIEKLYDKIAGLETNLAMLLDALTRIHGFLLPDNVILPDGRTFEFANPAIEREMFGALCTAIRDIPKVIATTPTTSLTTSLAAAKWAQRDDLIADIDSPAYIRDRDAAKEAT